MEVNGTRIRYSTGTCANVKEFLFGCVRTSNNTVADSFTYQDMEYYKIWDNGVLLRDFVPCERVSDHVLGMYDKVNDVFYTNLGTGEFISGGYITEEGTPEDYEWTTKKYTAYKY